LARKRKNSSKPGILFSFHNALIRVVVLLCMLAANMQVFAQKKTDTSDKVTIKILNDIVGIGVQTDSGRLQKLIGNVQIRQGETMLYADSVYQDSKNNLECFGNVRIIQPGTTVSGDYARYLSTPKLAYIKGKVSMLSGRSNLQTEELTYDVGTKLGTYENGGGALQDSNTTVTSKTGAYNGKSKDARFIGDVVVTDPVYHITSKDLGYNTESKLVTYFDSSITTSDKSILNAKNGTYDSKKGVAHFIQRASVFDDGEYIEADTLDYDRTIGFGEGRSNVITIDTTQHVTMVCGHVKYYKYKRLLLALVKPVMKQVNGKDSIFIRADTFRSAPISKPGDSIKKKTSEVKNLKKMTVKGKKKMITETAIADTTAADSTSPRYFIGYHHVLIYSDSLQGICDSISYTQNDSTMRMIGSPVAWSRQSQITGDTIILRMDSGKLKNIFVPNNAAVISQSGPDKAKMYDQVQGKTLFGIFKKNELNEMIVRPNAECIYYSKDDSGAYIGVNQAQSERMRIFFADRNLSRIVFEQDVHQTLTPLQQANIPTLKLSRFKWLADKRPKSRAELFK